MRDLDPVRVHPGTEIDHRAEGGTSCFVRNDPLAMGDTERLQRGGGHGCWGWDEGHASESTTFVARFVLSYDFPFELFC